MKTALLSCACYVLVTSNVISQPGTNSQSYQVPIHAGANLIANQLDHGSNRLADVLGAVPDGSQVYKYNNGNGTWSVSTYSAAAGSWLSGDSNTITLNPGEGAFFEAPTNFTLTFTGTPHVPVLPVSIPSGAAYLLSRQTNDVGTYENIIGTDPPDGALVHKWAGTNYVTYVADSTFATGWANENDTVEVPAPTNAVGESAWFSPSGNGAPAVTPTNNGFVITSPTNGTYCIGSSNTITWTGGNPSWNVEISLINMPAWAVYETIASSTPNTGHYGWNIPSWLPASTYEIYIQNVPLSTWSYGGTFTLTNCPTNCSLIMNCPSNIVVTNCFNVQEFYNPTASNICCGVNSTVTCSPPSGSYFTAGTTTTVNCTATDCAQNTNYCSFTVTVVRGTNCATNYLQVQCPSNIVVSSCTNIPVSYSANVIDPACSNWNIVFSPPSGSFFAPNTTNLVDCYVTDYCGESNDCSFTVTVLAPTNCPTNCIILNCPSNIVANTCSNCAPVNFSATAANSCCHSNVVISYSTQPGSCFPIGTTVVTVTAHDPDCLSTPPTQCTFDVTVLASTNCPTNCITLQCPSNITVSTCSNCATVYYSAPATNACCSNQVVVNYSTPPGTCFPIGTTTVTVTAYDPVCASTPPAQCAFNVTVAQGTNCNCCTNCTAPYPDSYTVTVWPGTNFIADNLCEGTNNTIPGILSTNVPKGTTVLVWNGVSYTAESYSPRAGWSGGNPVLSPGEGFILVNPTTSPYTLTIQGCPPNCPLPCAPTNGISFVGGLGTNVVVGWSNLFSCPPPCGTQIEIWDAANQSPAVYTYMGGGWMPPLPVPLLGVGESALVDANTNIPELSVICPTNKTVLCTSNWSFDPPIVSSCCTNQFQTTTGLLTNVLVTPLTPITNGVCPNVTVTQTWSIVDACGDTNQCSQIVTVTGCCTNPCIAVECPSNIVVTTCSNCVQVFYSANATVNGICCTNVSAIIYNPPSGTCFNVGVSNVQVSVYACGFVTNCEFTVTVIPTNVCTNCCTNCVQPYPYSYTNTLWPGYNFLADNLCQGTNNTLNDVLTNLPDGAEFLPWNSALNAYGAPQKYDATGAILGHPGWYDANTSAPSTNTLIPGEGFIINNPTTVILQVVISGCQPSCPIPCSPDSNWVLVGGLGYGPVETYSNLYSCPPRCGTEIDIYNTTNASYSQYQYVNGVWTPPLPIPLLAIGQSAFIRVASNANCCPTVTNLTLNTGLNPNSNNLYGFGQADAVWWVTKDPTLPPTTLPRPATVIAPNGAWQPAQPGSEWISSYATEANNLNGEYDFQTYFCTASDASNLVLSICLRADDAAACALNGNIIPLSPANTAFSAPSPACGLAINPSWFVYGGQNVLTVYVTNIYAVAMGLNADVSVTGSGLIPLGAPCCQFGSGISGQKFYDLNCNGVQDPGEPGLSGWTIQLSNGSNAVTDVNGYYYFTNLPPGTYTVTEVGQPNWTQSAPPGGSYTVTLTNLQQINNLNFGNCYTNPTSNQCVQIVCPANITVPCSTGNGAIVSYNVFATNLCGTNAVNLYCYPPPTYLFPVGTTTVNCTAWLNSGPVAKCSFTVTVLPCGENCIQLNCPSNFTVLTCSNCAQAFYSATANDLCCTNADGDPVTFSYDPPSGSCLSLGQNLVQVTATDQCGNSNSCSFTVDVINVTNTVCCGPGLGQQIIQWLQLPTNSGFLPDPGGSNTSYTWIITNLPCYGRVLITEDAPTNIRALLNKSNFYGSHGITSFDTVPNPSGLFEFTESGYGPYTWGVTPGTIDLGYDFQYFFHDQPAPLPPYHVNFYFLDGQPNTCSLYLAAVGLAQYTTNVLSQPLEFRTEYDLLLNAVTFPAGPSAETVVDGHYGSQLVSGIAGQTISSGYSINGGNDYNTGWALFQPTNALLTTNLPPGSGTDINSDTYPPTNSYPYLTVTVTSQEIDDHFSLTLGYVCCSNCATNCLNVQCPSNKVVQCGEEWMFDTPTAESCCSNNTFQTTTGGLTNVLIEPVSTITNGVCPLVTVTQTWAIIDGCGNSNTCSQIVTITGCCSNNCISIYCPSNIILTTCTNCVQAFYSASAVDNCCGGAAGGGSVSLFYSPPSGSCFNLGTNLVQVTATDTCSNSATCTFDVIVLQDTNCCSNSVVTNIVLNTGWDPNSNNVYGYGQGDATWWVTKDPTTNTIVPRPATVVDPNPAWATAQSNSGWISSYPTDADTLNGEYDFQTYFCAAADATNLVLNICLRADDVASAALNGHIIPLSPNNTAFSAPVPACGTVVNPNWFIYGGQNVVTVYVTNLYGVAMGLNADVNVSGTGLLPLGSPCCQLGSGISGQKFYDMNCNGVQDEGEPGIPGWSIVLCNGTNCVTNITDGNGYYYFTNLPPGTYTVTEVQQAGWTQSAPAGGSYTVTLTNLQQIIGLNFGNCNTNTNGCTIQLVCPTNIVATTCSNCVEVFYAAQAYDYCCNPGPAGGPVTLTYNPPSGTCFQPGVTTVQVTATDACGNIATCSFTVTVQTSTNLMCCGPGLGAQTIQWLNLPTSGWVVSNTPGLNPVGSWIVTNLPCYGNVLMTQNCPDEIYWFLNPLMVGASNSYGEFNFTETGYGPYSWGTGSWMDFYAFSNINYTVNFYFLDGQPNPCSLCLGVAGLAQNTTATASQPVTFRTEYDLYYNSSNYNRGPSAYTEVGSSYGPPLQGGVTSTVIGSAYNSTNYGDYLNTGWSVFQPNVNLPTTNLASGSVQGYAGPLTGLPYLSLNVSQEAGDGIGFTVGYICCTNCATNCLQVQCPANKTVPCGTQWTFDPPIATTCCTNELLTTAGLLTNVLVEPISTMTNGACPLVTVTQTWAIIDGCGNSNNCSQVVTVTGCCTNPCITVECPSNIVVTTCSNCIPVFYSANATVNGTCCSNVQGINYNPPPGTCFPIGTTPVQVTVYACGFVTNCEFTVTVNPGGGLQVNCPPSKTVQCGSNWNFDTPTATTCCTNEFQTSTGVTNVLITPLGVSTSGMCPQILTETWKIIDGCGDTNFCSQTVTVENTNPPTLVCASNLVITNGAAWTFTPPTVTDACCTNLTISVLSTTTNVSCNPCAINYTRTWEVVDCCTNTAVCSQTVSVMPEQPCQVFNTGLSGTNLLGGGTVDPNFALVSEPAGAFGPVPDALVMNPAYVPGSYLADGPNSEWLGPDAYADDEPAGVYHYQLKFLTCCTNNAVLAGQFAADNTAGIYFNGAQVGSIAAGSSFHAWTQILVTNNFVSCPALNVLDVYVTNFGSSIGDTTPSPTAFRAEVTNCVFPLAVYCPTNKAVLCDMDWSFDPPIASSCCPGPIEITPVDTVTNGTCTKLITRTWIISDACSNVAECSQTVTVLPAPPTLICASNKTVMGGTAWSFDPPISTNACCSNLTLCVLSITTNVTCNPCAINYTCTWQVTDCCTNTGTCSQTVSVIPESPCQAFNTGMSGSSPLAAGATDPNFNLVGAPDGALVITPVDLPGGYLPDGPNSQWIGPDAYSYDEPYGVYHYQLQYLLCCSNDSVLEGRIAADNTAGVYLNGHWIASVTAAGDSSWTPVSASNWFVGCPQLNVLDVYVTNYYYPFDPYPSSPTAFRAELTNCVSQLVVTCPTNKTVQCGSIWNFDPPTVESLCGGCDVVIAETPVTNGICPKVITETWVISNSCFGSSYTCAQQVTVVDTVPPIIACRTNVITVPLNSNCDIVIPSIPVLATDNCTPPALIVFHQNPPAGTIVPGPVYTVSIVAVDLCGNVSTPCFVTVEGLGKIGPMLSGPTNVPMTNCEVPCVLGLVSVVDHCCPPGSWTETQSPPCGTVFGPGQNTITVTVTDCNGLTASLIIHVTNGATSQSFLTNLYNTGVNNSYALLPYDAVDTHYALPPANVPPALAGTVHDYYNNAVAVSPGSYCHTGPATTPCALMTKVGTCYIYTPWTLAGTASEWIAPDYTNNECSVAGNYTYTLTFSLPAGGNPATASIQGRWACDNAGMMYLNNIVPANLVSSIGYPFDNGFAHWNNFNISPGAGFVAGVNHLYFVVTNVDSWTGLRVEFTNAMINCATCAPPSVVSVVTGGQSLPEFSSDVFGVTVSGTAPITYQWYHNNAPLANNATYSGVTTAYLHINNMTYAAAGAYELVASNPCGSVTNSTRLTVTPPGTQTGLWNVADLDNPLGATVGSNLIMTGSDYGTNYTITTGTTEDFGLPEEGGQIVNVMDVSPLPSDTSLQLPLLAPSGTTTANAYTIIMDVFQPDSSVGNSGTLFESMDCCISNLTSGGQDGVTITMDAGNFLHLGGSAAGTPFDSPSSSPLASNTWNRIALVASSSSSTQTAELMLYVNGVLSASATLPTAAGLPLNWANPPTLLTSDAGNTTEYYVSSIQYQGVAMTPDQIAGLGSPDDGPMPVNSTAAPAAPPVLTATLVNGMVNITWTGEPYALQETTSLDSVQWTDSTAAFTESQQNGVTTTTATAKPSSSGPSKFYRLAFRP